jgi:plasmid rolling circle replication initiator protein Rep
MGNNSAKNDGKRAMSEKTKPLLDNPALAAQESNKGSNAVMHGERISRLSQLKKRSRQMSSYMMKMSDNPLDTKTACDVAACSTWLVFNHYYTVDEVRLSKARTCKKHLLCPVCAKIRSVKQAIKYMERLEEILKEFPHLVPAMLTLTVKNGDDLKERFDHLTTSWKTYQNRRRQWTKNNRGFNELCRATGAVFTYEFTKSNEGWHPHLHAIVLLDSYIDREKLSSEWKDITKDSYIVDIRKIKASDKSDVVSSFAEVFKYALKFSEMPLNDNLEVFYKLRGKRLQGSYGSFWGVKVPEKMTDDLLDDLPYIELFYHYISGKGYNLEKTKKHEERLHLSEFEEENIY